MEKFSRWRDAGTGVAPLLPPVPPYEDSSKFVRALLFLPRVLVGTVRTLVVVVLLFVHFLLNFVFSSILHIPLSFLTSPLLRLVLFVIGYFWIDSQAVTIKRVPASQDAYLKPGKGDLIISNHSSWIDVVYLASKFNPTFIIPVTNAEDGDSNIEKKTPIAQSTKIIGFVKASSIWTILLSSSIGYPPVSLLSLKSSNRRRCTFYSSVAEALSKNEKNPVVLFPEATTSNNRGVLKPTSIPVSTTKANSQISCKVHIVSFKYDNPTPYSPTPITVIPPTSTKANSSFLSRIFSLISSIYKISASCSLSSRSLQFRILADLKETKGLSPFIKHYDQLSSKAWADQVVNLIAHLSNLRRTGITWQDKVDFLHYYHNSKTKVY